MEFTREQLEKFLEEMKMIRKFEENLGKLHKDGQVRGTLHLSVGQEAVAVGICSQLGQHDIVTGGHRANHIMLATGVTPNELLSETIGDNSAISGGNGGNMHLFAKSRGFWGANGIVAANIPISVGIALAKKLKAANGVVVTFIGDGTTTQGIAHEALNMASLYEVPLIVVCENNYYAQTTKLTSHSANPNLAEKMQAAYNIQSSVVDGNDICAVYEQFAQIYEIVNTTKKPYFIEALTYRKSGHSINDTDQKYRTNAELLKWLEKDPIVNLERRLKEYEI